LVAPVKFPIAINNVSLYLTENLLPEYAAVVKKRQDLEEELAMTRDYLFWMASVAGAAGIDLGGTDES
jgi:hypothetical protein